MENNPTILETLRVIEHKHAVTYEAVQARKQELDVAWQEMVKADRLLQERTEENAAWYKALTQSFENVFTPGTVIRANNGNLVVVESVTATIVHGWIVKEVPSKRQWTDASLYLSNISAIVSLDDITDKKLRRAAEKLIAKVRLKDW